MMRQVSAERGERVACLEEREEERKVKVVKVHDGLVREGGRHGGDAVRQACHYWERPLRQLCSTTHRSWS